MSRGGRDWQPTASRAMLQRRAAALRQVREFFTARELLEVDTPQLVQHAVTDVNIHSFEVARPAQAGAGTKAPLFLHTSPEYAMKRLLAAGTGDIWQMSHVFRGDEQGALHNAEFMLIEWYRVGWSMRQLMAEVTQLVQSLAPRLAQLPVRYLAYTDAVRSALGVDALTATDAALRSVAVAQGFEAQLLDSLTRDEVLDLLMGARIGPALGHDELCFVERYPASQAALARLDPADARVALRFELYVGGVELANGFEELATAAEQRARFENDNEERRRRGLPRREADEFLLAALGAGLPACSGVALGFDRVLMLAAGADRISDVLAFPADRA